VALCGIACITTSSSEHLSYEPSAQLVSDPQAVIKRVMATLPQTRVEFASDSFTVTFKSIDLSSPYRNQLVPHARIAKIELFTQSLDGQKWFGVLVTDKRLQPVLQVDSLSRDDAQALADAIQALWVSAADAGVVAPQKTNSPP